MSWADGRRRHRKHHCCRAASFQKTIWTAPTHLYLFSITCIAPRLLANGRPSAISSDVSMITWL